MNRINSKVQNPILWFSSLWHQKVFCATLPSISIYSVFILWKFCFRTSYNYVVPIIARSIFPNHKILVRKWINGASAVSIPSTDGENWNGYVMSWQYDVLFLNLYCGLSKRIDNVVNLLVYIQKCRKLWTNSEIRKKGKKKVKLKCAEIFLLAN